MGMTIFLCLIAFLFLYGLCKLNIYLWVKFVDWLFDRYKKQSDAADERIYAALEKIGIFFAFLFRVAGFFLSIIPLVFIGFPLWWIIHAICPKFEPSEKLEATLTVILTIAFWAVVIPWLANQ